MFIFIHLVSRRNATLITPKITIVIFVFSLLPAPVQQIWDRDDELKAKRVGSALVVSQTSVPPYGQRKGWIPRTEEDFGGLFFMVHSW